MVTNFKTPMVLCCNGHEFLCLYCFCDFSNNQKVRFLMCSKYDILFSDPPFGTTDSSGCYLPMGHAGPHEFKDSKAFFVSMIKKD